MKNKNLLGEGKEDLRRAFKLGRFCDIVLRSERKIRQDEKDTRGLERTLLIRLATKRFEKMPEPTEVQRVYEKLVWIGLREEAEELRNAYDYVASIVREGYSDIQ